MLVCSLALALAGSPAWLAAQTPSPPERIDLTIEAETERLERLRSECEAKQEAGSISGEIVVCGELEDDAAAAAGWDREEWENRYAAETQGQQPVDVAGAGIFRGKPTIGGLCIPGLQRCPPPPALIVDVAALPQAPPGSDADRIARGLAPLGESGEPSDPAQGKVASDAASDALGLPPVPDFAAAKDAEAEPVSPAGSEAPAAPQ